MALLAVGVQPAAALSCLRPDVTRSYGYADEAPDIYHVGRGTIALDPGQTVRGAVDAAEPEPYSLTGTFRGETLTRDGFDRPVTLPVRLDLACAGPWCGTPPDGEAVMFLRRDAGAGYVLTIGPCPRDVFAATPDVEARVLSCLRDGGCSAE